MGMHTKKPKKNQTNLCNKYRDKEILADYSIFASTPQVEKGTLKVGPLTLWCFFPS